MAEGQPKLATPEAKLRTVTGWTIFFLVLLRIAIGWHFFYEGIWKLKQDGWQATSYLVVAQGPLRSIFRGEVDLPIIGPMVEDVDGLEATSVEGAQEKMEARFNQLIKHYGIEDGALLDRIEDFKNRRKGSAEADPEFESVLAGASGRLTDAVYGDFVQARPDSAPSWTDGDAKAHIEAVLVGQLRNYPPQLAWENPSDTWFKPRRLPANDDADLAAAVQTFMRNREYQSKLELRKANFANEIRNYKLAFLESIMADPDFVKQRDDYLTLLAEIADYESKIGTMAYESERLMDMYARKAAAKNNLVARAQRPMNDMDNFLLSELQKAYLDAKVAKDEQAAAALQTQLAKGLPRHKSPTLWIDWANMIALTAVGAGLILGLFTRLSALGGVGLLMLYYWCMPSFPWLPEAGPLEGHYFFINKNIIEALALLVIATSGVGRWGGLDAFLFRKRRLGVG